jgi:hypothetical protein
MTRRPSCSCVKRAPSCAGIRPFPPVVEETSAASAGNGGGATGRFRDEDPGILEGRS